MGIKIQQNPTKSNKIQQNRDWQ